MKRQGFTLVEMLVAMTLTLFIMVIISQAFITGLDAFSKLKGVGDMDENLRVATNNLRYDLTQDHFEGKRRMSDPTFLASPPRQGFFRIRQATQPWAEGSDIDYFPNPPYASYGLDPTQIPPAYPVHLLHFTIKLRGNRRENFLTATVPSGSPLLTTNTNFFLQPTDAVYQGNSFSSQWAEVFYFVVANGKTTDPTATTGLQGATLFNLYRAQFVVAPRNDLVNGQVPGGLLNSYTNVSCNVDSSGNLYFYSPGDLAQQPAPPSTIPPANGTFVSARTIDPTVFDPIGNTVNRGTNSVTATSLGTIVSSNVVHFTVQMLTRSAAGVNDTDFNTDARDYDTAAGPAYQVMAVQITIRVWDQKTQQSRQITVVQDL